MIKIFVCPKFLILLMNEIIINKTFDINNYIFILKHEIKNHWIRAITPSVLFYTKNYDKLQQQKYLYIYTYRYLSIDKNITSI